VSPQPADPSGPERLQKALARAGFGSRRACEDLIRAGHVRVNGKRAELGMRVDPATDEVLVRGVRAVISSDLVYIALHKPTGYVTTASDPQGRPKVVDLVPREPRVFPVGRLDIDTSGLLFLTNDGDFANRIAHPRYGVTKTYVAEVGRSVGASLARKLVRGVELDDGPARAESAGVQVTSGGRSLVELVVHEGRNRLVRRMFDAAGADVTSLVRIAIGPVRLGRLKSGGWRTLKPNEVRDLLSVSEGGIPASGAVPDA
jgi:23S rRNA pseudouridine2605 synthase